MIISFEGDFGCFQFDNSVAETIYDFDIGNRRTAQ